MKIVFATNNKHKLDEIRDILGPSFEVLSLNDLGCHDDIPETGSTLEENALQKAQYIYDKFIAYDKVIFFEASLQLMQRLCRLAFLDLCDEMRYGCLK